MKNPKVGDKVAFYRTVLGAPTRRSEGTIERIGEDGRKCFVIFTKGFAHKRCVDRTHLVRLVPSQQTPRTRWGFDRHDGIPTDRLFTAPQAEFHARWLKSRGIGFKKVMWREVLEK